MDKNIMYGNQYYTWLMQVFLALVLLFSCGSSRALQSAELIFATPPTQSPEVTRKNYQPLVDYLAEVTGENIVLEPASNFQQYARNMREGHYDLVFDGPHFINWRIRKKRHVVVAKQPGELHFAIVVKQKSAITKLRDLWAKPICTPAVPFLGTLTVLEIYSNPVREPVVIPVQSFKDGLQCVREGRASAAIVRDKYWYKKADQTGLRVIHITKRRMPARGLTVNNRVSKLAQQKIVQALTSKKGREFSEKAFSSIGGGRFVKAKTTDYENLDELIKIVWGFHQ